MGTFEKKKIYNDVLETEIFECLLKVYIMLGFLCQFLISKINSANH